MSCVTQGVETMCLDVQVEGVVEDVLVVVLDAVEDAIAAALGVARSRVCIDDQDWTITIVAAEQDAETLALALPQEFRDALEAIKKAVELAFLLATS